MMQQDEIDLVELQQALARAVASHASLVPEAT